MFSHFAYGFLSMRWTWPKMKRKADHQGQEIVAYFTREGMN
jgi:hypothetical protein